MVVGGEFVILFVLFLFSEDLLGPSLVKVPDLSASTCSLSPAETSSARDYHAYLKTGPNIVSLVSVASTTDTKTKAQELTKILEESVGKISVDYNNSQAMIGDGFQIVGACGVKGWNGIFRVSSQGTKKVYNVLVQNAMTVVIRNNFIRMLLGVYEEKATYFAKFIEPVKVETVKGPNNETAVDQPPRNKDGGVESLPPSQPPQTASTKDDEKQQKSFYLKHCWWLYDFVCVPENKYKVALYTTVAAVFVYFSVRKK